MGGGEIIAELKALVRQPERVSKNNLKQLFAKKKLVSIRLK